MSSSEQENRERDQKIAHNEAVRRATSAVRISGWAIAFAVIIGAAAVLIVWAWLTR
ncbi:MAG TPA: hypothetical protein VKR55_13535 [Bradyrhizobium sp.]|uniref:hypothetical protein n=1 Tax=Bradyrhizobium sp. TaxID=376 RepID=UPI002B9A582D|nr:hypothetical protein [Bradyrhizobium sp.]HLZ03155.1 hypothetical protein [Bradyrhizobium sp.]